METTCKAQVATDERMTSCAKEMEIDGVDKHT
jgi:hypothetical protein